MGQRVVITGAGGAAAMAFFKAVQGEDVEVFMADMDPLAQGLFLVPPQRRALLPAGGDPTFAARLLELCLRVEADVVVPTVDAELVAVARAARGFLDCGIVPVVAKTRALATCLDKAALMAAVPPHLAPRWAVLDASYDQHPLSMPLVAKPRFGAGGRGVVVVRDAETLASLPRDGSLLVQEELPGMEYSVDVLSGPDGVPWAAVPRERLKVDSGVAVVGRTVADPLLQHLAQQAVTATGLSWVCNVQLKLDRTGVPRLLEINARFPGTMSLTVAAGVNMPAQVLTMARTLARGEAVPTPLRLQRFREVGMVRSWQEHFVDAEALSHSVARAVA